MFGKKAGSTAKSAESAKATSSPAQAAEGELILEQLFVEEPKTTKTPKFASVAEEADFIDVTPAKSATTKTEKPDKPKDAGFSFFKKRENKADAIKVESPRDLTTDASSSAAVEDIFVAPKTEATKQDSVAAKAPESPKVAKKEKPQNAARPKVQKPRKRSNEYFLLTEIGGGRTVTWKMTSQGVATIETVPANAGVISFSHEDKRFEVDGKKTQSQALSIALEEIGDEVHVLNRSKDLGAVYATLRSRVDSSDYRLGPGQLLVDTLVQARAKDAPALIIGLELKDCEGRDALLVLYYLSAAGRLSDPQVSIYPDNRDFLLSQFAAAHQAARESAQVLLLDNAAVFDTAAAMQFYPHEPMLGRVPARVVWRNAAFLSVLAAAASTSFAYQAMTQHNNARGQAARIQAQVQALQHANAGLLDGSPRALAKGLTLDLDHIIKLSHSFWVPGARVQLKADGTGTDYLITVQMMKTTPSGAPSASAPINQRAVDALLNLKTPEECTRGALNFSGTFNEAQLSIRCEAPPSALDRYRDR